MENVHDEINVEKIMQEIREKISQRNYDDVMPFSEVSEKALLEADRFSMDELSYRIEKIHRQSEDMKVYKELKGNVFAKQIKKAIMKAITFVFKPFAEDQINYDLCLAKTLDQIYLYLRDEGHAEKMNPDQEKKYFENHDELINTLTNRILQLENRISELEKRKDS